jgi:osmotically-inducible protein OsmY
MRRLKRRALGFLLAGVLAAGGARAGDAEDVALTVAVRKALTRDEKLATLGLGVTVADGRVRVWGPVPSPDLVVLVEARIRDLAGVKVVTNEVHVLPRDAVDADRKSVPRMASGPQPVVLSPMPGSPLPLVRIESELERSAPAPVVRPDESRRTAAKEPPLEILAPVMTRPNPTLLRPDPADAPAELELQIESVLVRKVKYDGVNVAIQSGILRLSGTLQHWSDLWPLSEELSNVPGVKRVVVDKITIAK